MVEVPINQKAMEDAILKALPNYFPSHGMISDPAVEFYDKFKHAADDHDNCFIKKYDEDLNSTLIFAGLFSAVTSAFVIDVQRKLEPDFEEMNHTLLKIVASAALGNVPTGADAALPEWKGPDSTIVHVQAILYASLSTTLLAAFVAMLGKQWLNRYASVERGSVIDRCRQRKRKMDGMVTWKFGLVMECLPLMLQAALLLLGYALSNYLFFIDRVVASVVIGFLTSGLLFYFLIGAAATLSYNCPFQTPLSLILRFFIRFDNQRGGYLKWSKKWFGYFLAWMRKRQQRQGSSGPSGLRTFGAENRNSLGEHVELDVTNSHPLFERVDWDGYKADSDCIAWMFEMPMDIDLTMAMARFIPEVPWNPATRTIPLERLYDALFKCFDQSLKHAIIVKPSLRDHAYSIAKALIHVAIQRKWIDDESNIPMFRSISYRHIIMGSEHYEGDSDLEVTLGIIDHVFGDSKPMHWQNFKFTTPHHAWMGHILLYSAWDILGKGEPLPDCIWEFVLYSLRLEPPPPAAIIADCLFIVGLVLGIGLHADDLLVADKSCEINPQIDRIYKKLTKTFRNPSPTAEEIDRALESMELIAPLSQENVAQKSYELFHVVMQAPVSPTFLQEKKWEASRLAMHGAYKWDTFLPWVGNPLDILTFLDYHFDLATRGGQNQDEPIQNALRALAYASGRDVTIEALKRFDPTKPSFVYGICYVYRSDRPFEIRRAALFFLPLIGDRWFNSPRPIMRPDQMRSLCVDWASAVDAIDHSPDVQEAILSTLFGMINSPHWRPHIVADKWNLLEYFPSATDDPQPLRRCVDNPELMDAIRDVANPAAMTLWMKILWLKYKELIPVVQRQLEVVTKEVAQGRRRGDLEMYQSTIESELMKAEDTLTQYTTWSTDPAAVALRTEIENLQHAKHALVSLKRG